MMQVFEKIKQYFTNQSGITAITFALATPALIAAVGLSLDMAQAYLVHDRLGRSLDASALAAAASSGDTAAITQRFEDYFHANYPAQGLGEPYDLALSVDDTVLTVTAKADVYTKFMNIFGFEKITVNTASQVKRETRGIEVGQSHGRCRANGQRATDVFVCACLGGLAWRHRHN